MPRKILVVDDEPLIAKGLRFSLEQEGYAVDCAFCLVYFRIRWQFGGRSIGHSQCVVFGSCIIVILVFDIFVITSFHIFHWQISFSPFYIRISSTEGFVNE